MFPTTDKQLTCLVGALTFKRLSQDTQNVWWECKGNICRSALF